MPTLLMHKASRAEVGSTALIVQSTDAPSQSRKTHPAVSLVTLMYIWRKMCVEE